VQLLGRLLTRMLFFHCQRRQHPERAFFFYLDECQLSSDVSRMLTEARKYGVVVTLSHQYLGQLAIAGGDILGAVRNAKLTATNPLDAEWVNGEGGLLRLTD
jgi:hypothetical protein